MNRKEIAEIRKLLCMQRNPIHTIYGCYVNSEKDLLSEFKHPALSLPEDELFKYLDIFRKALSGKKEKNLTQVDFPLSEESAGGTQHFLYQFCNGTGDIQEDALEELYGIIVENYTTVENYAILVALGAYDVPGKATDGTIMDDASETTYCFIICCICPVKKTRDISFPLMRLGGFDRRLHGLSVMTVVQFVFRSISLKNLIKLAGWKLN